MADECIEFRKIEHRCSELREWIVRRAPQCLTEQKHLRENSPERAYWAHGYLAALVDVLGLFSRDLSRDQAHESPDPAQEKYAA
jgi:hypothetical protein